VRAAPRALAATLACLAIAGCGSKGGPLLSDHFGGDDGLITNEYALRHPGESGVHRSKRWQVTSGSFFQRGGRGWTGVPDGESPGRDSTKDTGSAVFRLTSRREIDGPIVVAFTLDNVGLTTTPRTPAHAYDGVHLILRWQSSRRTYYLTLNRRDDTIILKKKLPDDSPAGRYFDLTPPLRHRVPYGRPQRIRAVLRDLPGGAVAISLAIDGVVRLRATDRGTGGSPIHGAGRVGLRGDNDQFFFDDLEVTRPHRAG
jgi:hypothetical protein